MWVIIATGRTFYNFTKVLSEEKDWIFLTDTQKREKIFGDLNSFFTFVQKHTPLKSKIIFLSPGGKTYYLGRYYLYPREIAYAKDVNEALSLTKTNKYTYLLLYRTTDVTLNENYSENWQTVQFDEIYRYTTKNTTGVLYKL